MIPTLEFTANLRVISASEPALAALIAAVRERLTDHQRAAIALRRERHEARSHEHRERLDRMALERRSQTPIDKLWLSYQIGQTLDDNCVVFDDTLAHNRVLDYLHCDRPGSYFNNPGTSGGWAPGAAFGAKLAAPERDMVAITGDGFYMFANANAAIWAATMYDAPFLSIVYQNRSYTTGTVSVTRTYTDGYAERAGFAGGYFDPPVDLAAEARAAGAFAETVHDPAEIGPAIRRGLDAIRNGTPAVICIWLPRLLQET